VILVVAGASVLAALSVVDCRGPTPPVPEDAGCGDAGVTSPCGRTDAGVDAAVVGPRPGDTCTSSLECGTPAMICCAGVCLPPSRCM
jgi:hypothetical protein